MDTSQKNDRPVKARKKPARFVRWALQPGVCSLQGVLVLTVGKEMSAYVVRPIPADGGGSGWELAKLRKTEDEEATVYHVHLDRAAGRHTCACKGFLRWSHCKHVSALLALPAAEVAEAVKQPRPGSGGATIAADAAEAQAPAGGRPHVFHINHLGRRVLT
jgi:hypothetical protein